MKLDRQKDIFRHSPARMAWACRQAAEAAAVNPYYSPEQRQQRAQHYRDEARRHESQKGMMK